MDAIDCRSARFLRAVAIAAMFSWSPLASAQTPYTLELLAQGLEPVGDRLSINDAGTVAFSSEGVFLVDDPGETIKPVPQGGSTTTELQLNDTEELVVRTLEGSARKLQLINLQEGIADTLEVGGFPFCSGGPNAGASCLGNSSCATGEGFCQILTSTCVGGPRDGDFCAGSIDCKEPSFCYRPSLQDVGHSPSINNLGQVVHVGSDGKSLLLLLPNLERVRLSGFDYREVRPQIADTGLVVVREGGLPTSPLVLFDFAGGLTQYATRIVVAENWTAIGRAPGVTRDGGLVAWAGDRGNGPGVFVAQPSLPTQIWPVAGDGNDDFANIVIDQQVAIENVRLPDGSSETRVVFVGEHEGDVGAYSVSVALRAPGPDLGPPSPILRVGDFVDSQKVFALELSDRINSRGEVAFRVVIGNEGIVRAKPARSQIVFREKADANGFWGVVGGEVPFTWDHVGFYYAPEDLVYESHPGYNGDTGPPPEPLTPPVFDNCFWDPDFPPGPPDKERKDVLFSNRDPRGSCNEPTIYAPLATGLQAVHNKNTFAALSGTSEAHSVQFEAIDIESSCADCMRNWIRARAQGGFPPWTTGQPECDEGGFLEQASCFASALANPVILDDWLLRQKGKDGAFSCVGLVESAAEACVPCNPTLEGFVPNALERLFLEPKAPSTPIPGLESVALPTLTPGKMLAVLRARSKKVEIRSHLELFGDPVDFVLTDPDGLQLGYTPSLGEINDIPNSFYGGDASVEEVVVFNPKPGIWTLDIFGLGEEALVAAGGSTGVSSVFLNETLAEGEIRGFSISVPALGGTGGVGGCAGIATTLPNPVSSGPVSFRTVALSGQQVPCADSGRVFSHFSTPPPAMNSTGEVVFYATERTGPVGNSNGSTWRSTEDSSELTRISDFGGSLHLNDHGRVAPGGGTLIDTDGSQLLVVGHNDPAPGTSDRFDEILGDPISAFLSNRELILGATLNSRSEGFHYTRGVWKIPESGGDLTLLIREGDPAPGVSGTEIGFLPRIEQSTPTNFTASLEGAMVLRGYLRASGSVVDVSNDEVFWIRRVGESFELLLREGDPVPSLPDARFRHFDTVSVNDPGDSVVVASLTGPEILQSQNDEFLFRVGRDGAVARLAQRGDCAAGMSEPFRSFLVGEHSLNNAGDVAFWASTVRDGGIWFARGGQPGQPGLVVRQGDQAPGRAPGVQFFPNPGGAPVMNQNGDVLAIGQIRDPAVSNLLSAFILFPVDGDPVLVAARGDTLDFGSGDRRTINTVAIRHSFGSRYKVLTEDREMLLLVSFTDGSDGVFVAKVDVPRSGSRVLRRAQLCGGKCDIDRNASIDRRDVDAIFAARGTAATGEDDLRDADGDGLISAGDGRACSLECSQPECALPAGSASVEANRVCGLLGIEVLGLLGIVGWVVRRSQHRRGSR